MPAGEQHRGGHRTRVDDTGDRGGAAPAAGRDEHGTDRERHRDGRVTARVRVPEPPDIDQVRTLEHDPLEHLGRDVRAEDRHADRDREEQSPTDQPDEDERAGAGDETRHADGLEDVVGDVERVRVDGGSSLQRLVVDELTVFGPHRDEVEDQHPGRAEDDEREQARERRVARRRRARGSHRDVVPPEIVTARRRSPPYAMIS